MHETESSKASDHGFSEGFLPRSEATEPPNQESSSEWTFGRALTAYGVHIGIRTNRPDDLAQLNDYLPPVWTPRRQPGVDRVFSILCRDSGCTLSEELLTIAKVPHPADLLDTLRRHIKMYVAEMSPDYVFIHAGAVGWRGKAVLVPGRTFTGKTSLVAAMIRAGATYYSDDYAVLDLEGKVHPYPQPLGVRAADSDRQQSLSPESLGGTVGTKPLPVGRVVVAPYEPGAIWDPQPLTRGEAALELLANTVPARSRPDVVLATLQKALAESRALRGPRGEARDIAAELLDG